MRNCYIKSIPNTEVKYNGTFTITQNIRGRLNLKGKGPFFIINRLIEQLKVPASIDNVLLFFNEKNRDSVLKIIQLLLKNNLILLCDSDIEKNFELSPSKKKNIRKH